MSENFESKLNEIAELKADWDSYGGLPIGQNAIMVARLLLTSFEELGFKEPAIVPTADGGISLEWWAKKKNSTFTISINHSGLLESLFALSSIGHYEAQPNTDEPVEVINRPVME